MPVESAGNATVRQPSSSADLESPPIGGGQQVGLALTSATPDRADGVDHVAGRQASGARRLRVAGRTAAEARALLEDLVAACTTDRAAHSRGRDQRLVRSVDDRVHVLLGEIADDECDH